MKKFLLNRIHKFKALRSKMSAKYGDDDDIVQTLTVEIKDLEAQLEAVKAAPTRLSRLTSTQRSERTESLHG